MSKESAALGGGTRLLELVAVFVLGITTLGTAWCGFEAAKWAAQSSSLSQVASDQRVEASRLFGAGTQVLSYDSTTIAQYAAAMSAGDSRLTSFYRDSLVRPGFLPVLEQWEADVRAGRTPTRLTEDKEYLATIFGEYEEAVAAAEAASKASEQAGNVANNYVGTTILLAVALFFAGVTSSFRSRPAVLFLLFGSIGVVIYTSTRLASLPVLF